MGGHKISARDCRHGSRDTSRDFAGRFVAYDRSAAKACAPSGHLSLIKMSFAKAVDRKQTMRAVVFCPGPMGIFEQSLALEERGWLQTMAIDYYCDLSSPRFKWLPEGRIKKYLRKRYHPPLNSRRVRTRLL